MWAKIASWIAGGIASWLLQKLLRARTQRTEDATIDARAEATKTEMDKVDENTSTDVVDEADADLLSGGRR